MDWACLGARPHPTGVTFFYRDALRVCFHLQGFWIPVICLIYTRQHGRYEFRRLLFPPERPLCSQRPGFKRTDTILPTSFTLEIFWLRCTVPPTPGTPYMTDVSRCTIYNVHHPTTELSHKLTCTIQPHVCKLARRQCFTRNEVDVAF